MIWGHPVAVPEFVVIAEATRGALFLLAGYWWLFVEAAEAFTEDAYCWGILEANGKGAEASAESGESSFSSYNTLIGTKYRLLHQPPLRRLVKNCTGNKSSSPTHRCNATRVKKSKVSLGAQ
eukprot:scaffold7799_cov94-Skeletonema_dohrnii-CCMP3373.AAC.1